MRKQALIAGTIIFIFCLSCKKNDPVLSTQNATNRQVVIARSRSGAMIKIACEGTSLTYGEDIYGLDTTHSQPGFPAAITRAKYQYPSSMIEAINNTHLVLSVRGFPGDRTTEAIDRWKDSTMADICIIEYGTNDAYNFGGYSSGIVSPETYKQQLMKLAQRRIDQGAWVILCIPPYLEDDNQQINPYREAASSVAHEISLDVFDVERSIKRVVSPYSDRVHLSSAGYRQWGLDIAPLLYKLNGNSR